MPRVRRPAFTFLYLHDGSFLDVEALLRGEARPAPLQQLLALSLLTGDEVPITRADVDLLSAVPPDEWVDADALGEPDRVAALTSAGLLVADSSEPRPAELRRRDEQLRGDEWNAYAALYHFMTRWRDVDVGLDPSQAEVPPPEAVEEFVRSHGAPPETFHAARNVRATDPLPAQPLDGALGGALARRATTRRFDPEARVTRDELATVLAAVYGARAYTELGPGLVALRKTSPSGGGLHPVEVYPLVVAVDGVASGLHHYNVGDHSLELVEPLPQAKARELADRFTCGQGYPRTAHVLFLLTGRFRRSFWKYRAQERAYAVLLMDAAHLSQTLYLVCADLGLGAFVTAAINGETIEDRLGLDGFAEGALLVSGCGRPARDGGPPWRPYVPRQTRLP